MDFSPLASSTMDEEPYGFVDQDEALLPLTTTTSASKQEIGCCEKFLFANIA
jgi:hypothetical protein